jgi:hypothetical protein
MYGIEDYAGEMERIFREAAGEIAEFPAGLREVGLEMLARANPLLSGSGSNGISYLLPYWLREVTGGPVERSRSFAVGNLHAMLHFFLLDDAMDREGDGGGPVGIREALVLSQLFQERFRQRYERQLADGSLLWSYYGKYVREWADAIHREPAIRADPGDLRQLAGKAAPVKIGAAGMLLAAGLPERIPETEEAVDLALAALQLSDDWADWREDLPLDNRNAFLTIVREQLSIPDGTPLDEPSVNLAVSRLRALERLADYAEAYGERLRSIPGAPESLIRFQNAIARGIRDGARSVEEKTNRLAIEGGFDYLLSKF